MFEGTGDLAYGEQFLTGTGVLLRLLTLLSRGLLLSLFKNFFLKYIFDYRS